LKELDILLRGVVMQHPAILSRYEGVAENAVGGWSKGEASPFLESNAGSSASTGAEECGVDRGEFWKFRMKNPCRPLPLASEWLKR
jgi:hypothetical protein